MRGERPLPSWLRESCPPPLVGKRAGKVFAERPNRQALTGEPTCDATQTAGTWTAPWKPDLGASGHGQSSGKAPCACSKTCRGSDRGTRV